MWLHTFTLYLLTYFDDQTIPILNSWLQYRKITLHEYAGPIPFFVVPILQTQSKDFVLIDSTWYTIEFTQYTVFHTIESRHYNFYTFFKCLTKKTTMFTKHADDWEWDLTVCKQLNNTLWRNRFLLNNTTWACNKVTWQIYLLFLTASRFFHSVSFLVKVKHYNRHNTELSLRPSNLAINQI